MRMCKGKVSKDIFSLSTFVYNIFLSVMTFNCIYVFATSSREGEKNVIVDTYTVNFLAILKRRAQYAVC